MLNSTGDILTEVPIEELLDEIMRDNSVSSKGNSVLSDDDLLEIYNSIA
jgi:hypothetical protein